MIISVDTKSPLTNTALLHYKNTDKTRDRSREYWHTPLVSKQGRQADLCNFKAFLNYITSIWPTRAAQRNPVFLEIKTPTKTKNRRNIFQQNKNIHNKHMPIIILIVKILKYSIKIRQGWPLHNSN